MSEFKLPLHYKEKINNCENKKHINNYINKIVLIFQENLKLNDNIKINFYNSIINIYQKIKDKENSKFYQKIVNELKNK